MRVQVHEYLETIGNSSRMRMLASRKHAARASKNRVRTNQTTSHFTHSIKQTEEHTIAASCIHALENVCYMRERNAVQL